MTATRVVPDAGWPGKWVAQYRNDDMSLWFDIGEPEDTPMEAAQKIGAHLAPTVNNTLTVLQHHNGDWYVSTASPLTDAQAAGITFRATPEQVRLGAYVQVRDGNGIRIGHVGSATYRERAFGPAYVVCSIHLR